MGAFAGGQRPDGVVEARDADPAGRRVDEGVQRPDQGPGRVLDRGGQRRMDVDRRAARLQLHVEHAARAEHEDGPTARVEIGRLHEREIAGELRRVAPDVVLDGDAVDLLLALDEELDGQRQLAPDREQRLDGRQSRDEVALVVGHTPGVEAPVTDRRLERRREPLLERVRRLDVVVVVEEQGRGGAALDLGVDGGRVVGRHDLGRQAPAAHQGGDGVGRLGQRIALGRDARQTAELGEAVEVALGVGFDVRLEGGVEARCRGRHGPRV